MGMVKQSYNKKTGAYVKYKTTAKGAKILNVKQSNPTVPFKNVPIAKKKKKY